MNQHLNGKCKCLKKVRNIEVTTYKCDPKCLSNMVPNKKKLPEQVKGIVYDSCIGKELENPVKVVQYIYSAKSSGCLPSKNELSKVEVKSVKICHANTVRNRQDEDKSNQSKSIAK